MTINILSDSPFVLPAQTSSSNGTSEQTYLASMPTVSISGAVFVE